MRHLIGKIIRAPFWLMTMIGAIAVNFIEEVFDLEPSL